MFLWRKAQPAHLQMRRQQRVAQYLAAHVVVLGDAELRFGPEAVPGFDDVGTLCGCPLCMCG